MICGKIIYPTQYEANTAIKGTHRDKRVTKSKVKTTYSYFCNDCSGWHLCSSGNGHKRIKKRFAQDKTETVNASGKFKRAGDIKSGTGNLIIHSRLNFKVK